MEVMRTAEKAMRFMMRGGLTTLVEFSVRGRKGIKGEEDDW